MEKLFPGQGYSLSPEKKSNKETFTVVDDDDGDAKPKEILNKKYESRVDGKSFPFLVPFSTKR